MMRVADRGWFSSSRTIGVVIVVLLVTSACGPSERSSAPGAGPAARAASPAGTPKGTLTMSLFREPAELGPRSTTGGAAGAETNWIFNSPLTYYDLQGTLRPMMAQHIPSRESSEWLINPDGTMVTTFRLRENVRWHDGAPLTAADFAFAYQVYTDPALPFRPDNERLMSEVSGPDDLTVVINWAEPYIHAIRGELPPLPRHLLERKYQSERAEFGTGEEWTTAYVGSGPFRLERWEPGVRIVARAFPEWFLGPPRIEMVQIRFVENANALLANLLAGEVDFASAPAIRISHAVVAREQWTANGEGYLRTWERRLRYLEFQYREVPNWQPALTDPQIRQALIHAVDRQALADVMTQGLGRAADAWVLPLDPLFAETDRTIVKYPYDPQRALSLLAAAGWRPQSGGSLTNAAGHLLNVELNTGSTEPELATIIVDNWKAVGIHASVAILPIAQQRDPLARANFPAIRMGERSISMESFSLLSSLIPTPPLFNQANFGSFSDSEVDRLHTLAMTSFDERVQRQSTVAMNRRLAELAAYGPLYYNAEVLLARSRLQGVQGEAPLQTGVTWNIFEWQVAD
jgi:peptide/nickel transport system substrate-binding protein